MAADNKEVWINAGYEIFALKGHGGLKVEPLARKVGKSKSSFYHHFADLDVFIDVLLQRHIQQSYLMADKEQKASTVDPELIHILVEHKNDLLFNRQLRINQNIKTYADILIRSNKIVGDVFVYLWVKDLNLALSQKQLEGIFTLALENFYLQINADNLCYDWLSAYFAGLKKITQNFV